MKKTFGIYTAGWVVVLALFNLITFITPNEINGESKFGAMFWVSYVLITLMFIGQLACAYFVFKADSAKKLFYNISLIPITVAAIAIMFIASVVCVAIIPVPDWLGIIICAIILAVNIIAVLKAAVAIDAVEAIDKKIKVKTMFIKMLTADAEALMINTASSEELAPLTKKVYEAVRYSDPMSDDALMAVEDKITAKFNEFSESVNEGNAETAEANAKVLLTYITERNTKCKILK
ncbi:MAG: hypothetical protein IJ437_05180 [Clostridia bacterium]|nr:hypothetical protein [Clostridia bacterium]